MSTFEKYKQAYLDHVATWGPNCGAPKSVYKGHLDSLLSAYREWLTEQAAITAAIQSQYPIEDDYDRGYSQGRKDASRDIRNKFSKPEAENTEEKQRG
jgi:hypothetical protein